MAGLRRLVKTADLEREAALKAKKAEEAAAAEAALQKRCDKRARQKADKAQPSGNVTPELRVSLDKLAADRAKREAGEAAAKAAKTPKPRSVQRSFATLPRRKPRCG